MCQNRKSSSFLDAAWNFTSLRFLTAFSAMMLVALPLQAQPIDTTQLLRSIQIKLDSLQRVHRFPGATVGIVLPDEQPRALATGFSDVEKQIPMQPDDRMFSGSVGKTFVAAVALQLVQEGRLDLDEPIKAWFAEDAWLDQLPNGDTVTLRMLLSHTSGIPGYLEHDDLLATLGQMPSKSWTPEERIGYVLGSTPLSTPGNKFSYTDTNYILSGMVIERAIQGSYYEQLDSVLASLQLRSTQPSDTQVLCGLIQGYSSNIRFLRLEGLTEPVEIRGIPLGKVLSEGRYVFNPQLEWTGGGLVTTAGDLARWAKALFEGEILEEPYLQEMLVSGMGSSITSSRYGLGVQIRHSGHWGVSYGHSGWMPGYHSDMEYFPQYGVAVAAQVNTDDTDLIDPRQIVFEVMGIIAEALPAKP